MENYHSSFLVETDLFQNSGSPHLCEFDPGCYPFSNFISHDQPSSLSQTNIIMSLVYGWLLITNQKWLITSWIKQLFFQLLSTTNTLWSNCQWAWLRRVVTQSGSYKYCWFCDMALWFMYIIFPQFQHGCFVLNQTCLECIKPRTYIHISSNRWCLAMDGCSFIAFQSNRRMPWMMRCEPCSFPSERRDCVWDSNSSPSKGADDLWSIMVA